MMLLQRFSRGGRRLSSTSSNYTVSGLRRLARSFVNSSLIINSFVCTSTFSSSSSISLLWRRIASCARHLSLRWPRSRLVHPGSQTTKLCFSTTFAARRSFCTESPHPSTATTTCTSFSSPSSISPPDDAYHDEEITHAPSLSTSTMQHNATTPTEKRRDALVYFKEKFGIVFNRAEHLTQALEHILLGTSRHDHRQAFSSLKVCHFVRWSPSTTSSLMSLALLSLFSSPESRQEQDTLH